MWPAHIFGVCAVSIAWASPQSTGRWRRGVGSLLPEPTFVGQFQQRVDHFNLQRKDTWRQKYLVDDTHYRAGGPLFFYAGNEAPIEAFWKSTGLMFDWAPEFGAAIVFGEHRFYGASLPFGNASFERGNLGFLSIQQALADFAALVTSLKETLLKDPQAPVVVFGGSYAGILAAFLRLKYPNVFDMALAASAPILINTDQNFDPTVFYKTVTDDARDADQRCPAAVRDGFLRAIETAQEGQGGLERLSNAFGLCKSLTIDEISHFILYVRNAWANMGMGDHPYAVSSLPANPINVACQMVINGTDPLVGLAAAVAMAYATPDTKCFDMYEIFIECADQTGCGTGGDAIAWDYQICTQLLSFVSTNNVTDMFPAYSWNLTDANQYCQKTYGVQPDVDFIPIAFGGLDLGRVTSRIIFSNGLRDPWHGGGFLKDLSETLPAVVIPTGAHHLDLRGANPEDPQDVTAARLKEKAFIKQWLAERQVAALQLFI